MEQFKVGDRVRITHVILHDLDVLGKELIVDEVDEYNGVTSGGRGYIANQLALVTTQPKQPTPPLYVFSDIPNDEDGKAFIAQLREYANTDRYRVRVRGQYLKPGNDWRRYQMGQPMALSKCLRVYIEEK